MTIPISPPTPPTPFIDGLAFTGTPVGMTLVLGGFGTIVLGALLVLPRRRRHQGNRNGTARHRPV
ncbi:MAG: hypothetical protein WDM88_04435 [Galbitalea sp.]